MISLNNSNGNLIVNQEIFDSTMVISQADDLKLQYEVMTRDINNSKWYSILINEWNIIVLVFTENKLNFIQLFAGQAYAFPPFIITDEEKTVAKKNLIMLGGEAVYSWGSVKYIEDNKAGTVCVVIRYSHS